MPRSNRSTREIERRLATRPLVAERRQEGEEEAADERMVLRGHAALFNSPTVIWGMFEEEIAPGAFADAIGEGADVRALWNHDPTEVLGRTLARTLELEEDELGLAVAIYPPDTERGRAHYESVRRGDVSQMSFSFHATREEWIEREDGKLPLRRVLECELFEVSPVTFPAYELTDIAARSEAEAKAKAILEARNGPAARRAAFKRLQRLVRLAAAE